MGHQACRRPTGRAAFSLIEMLVVIAIIGILAAASAPAIRGLSKTNIRASGERQILDDLGMARQYAIKNRTRTYLVFAPVNRSIGEGPFYNEIRANLNQLQGRDPAAADRLLRVLTNVVAGSLSSYAIVAEGAVGDQPGTRRWRYLQDWRSLPDGILFPNALFESPFLFGRRNDLGRLPSGVAWRYFPFPQALNVDYGAMRSADRRLVVARLPHVGFEPTGRMVLHSQVIDAPDNLMAPVRSLAPPGNELWLGLSEGSAFVPRNAAGQVDFTRSVDVVETPPGNFTNGIIKIAALTGRAKLERPKLP